MPELPEVENVLRGLRPVLEGRRFAQVQVLNAAIIKAGRECFEAEIPRRLIVALERRGKYILLHLESGFDLVFHLGMTGKLYFAPPADPVEKHTHLIFDIEGVPRQLRHCDARRFGGAYLLEAGQETRLKRLDRLGAEPLELDAKSFRQLFEGRRARMKALLLDQSVVAGVGNIYADEALHRAGIHPKQLAADLSASALDVLHRHLVRILKKAIEAGGSSISDYVDAEGYRGQYQNYYRVYDRESQGCLTPGCAGTVRRIQVAGRSSHYCPRCQRLRYRQSPTRAKKD